MDQLVQDFNTALDETAGSGSARSVLFIRFWNLNLYFSLGLRAYLATYAIKLPAKNSIMLFISVPKFVCEYSKSIISKLPGTQI